MKKFFIFSFLILILLSFSMSWAATEEKTIRVCLDSQIEATTIRISSGSYELRDQKELIQQISSGDKVEIFLTQGELYLKVNNGKASLVEAAPLLFMPAVKDELDLFSHENIQYRGQLTVDILNQKMLVINCLPLEEYLLGVVGEEMGTSADLEALKVQAVVSRSYALAHISDSNLYYDVKKGTSNQCYRGYSAEKVYRGEQIKKAVDATRHQVLTYTNSINDQKKVISAFFHANAGGYTENSENVFSAEIPYLQGVPSPEDDYALQWAEENDQAWAKKAYMWQVAYTQTEINELLAEYMQKFEQINEVGSFKEIKLYRQQRSNEEETVSGRVTKMEVVGDKGVLTLYRDSIRSLFNLRSTKFELYPNLELTIKDKENEPYQLQNMADIYVINAESKIDLFQNSDQRVTVIGAAGTVQLSGSNEVLVFSGQGYGHGIGLSQWGARGMAQAGKDYQEILYHYYNKAALAEALQLEDYGGLE